MKSLALALTWDGAHIPSSALPPKARAFLAGKTPIAPKTVAKLFADDQIQELRICWAPRLKGGWDVLSGPFFTSTQKRLSFQTVRTTRFGDVLGVIYRRLA
jgi:hypothetical protein